MNLRLPLCSQIAKPLALSTLVAGLLVISSCSSGGGGSSEIGTTAPPPQLPPEPTSPPLSGVGFPQEPEQPARLCPQNVQSDAASNTAVSVAFPLDIDESSISSDSLSLLCNDLSVVGTTSAVGPRLIFEPETDLAAGANCTATVGSNVLLSDGSAAGQESWVFQTGPEQRSDFHFSEPKIFDIEGLHILDMLYLGNRLIIVQRDGDILYITTSIDQGETFVRSDPIFIYGSPIGSVIQAVEMVTHDRVLYLIVTAGGPNAGPPETFFVRSDNGAFTSFREPVHLPSVSAYSYSSRSSMSITDDGTIYRAWYEWCVVSQCELDVEGNYLQILDTSGFPLSLEKIWSWEFTQPIVTTHQETVYLAMTRSGNPTVNDGDSLMEIFNYSDGMRLLGEFGELGPAAQFMEFNALGDGRIAFSWAQRDLADDEYRIHISYLDPASDSLSGPHLASSKTSGESVYRCGFVKTDENGSVSLITGLSEELDAPVIRGAHFSNDFGQTFSDSVWSENLGSRYRRKIPDTPFDYTCPLVAITPNNIVYSAWIRWYWDSTAWYFRHAVLDKAETVAPCSRPNWSGTDL